MEDPEHAQFGPAPEGFIGLSPHMPRKPSAARIFVPSRALRALKRLGPLGFARLGFINLKLLISGRYREHRSVYDRSFDREHGVDTAGTIAIEELDASDDLRGRAERYEAADPEFFNYMLDRSGLTRRDEYLFVDLGSGKGRGLLLAALAGFRRVIGVELDLDLHTVARGNIEIFRKQHPDVDFTTVNEDATKFAFPPLPFVLFLNNPFDAHILEKVLNNLETMRERSGQDVLLLYMHSNHQDLVRQREGWEELDAGICRNNRQFYAISRWPGGQI